MRLAFPTALLAALPTALLAALPTALLAALLAATTVAASDDATKTLTRTHDPISIRGTALADLHGHTIASLRLLAVEDGKAVPIPFQIDERDEEDRIVLTDPPPGRTLDADDELVFMAADSGDRLAEGKLPGGSGRALEIEITDPLSGERGWAYLAVFGETAPPLSEKSYVHFDRVANQGRSELYSVDYDVRGNFFTGFRIATLGGGNGENLIHRTRMRGAPTFSLLLGRFEMSFTEEDSLMVLTGVKNGPVRATRHVELSVDLGGMLPQIPSGQVDTYHYRSSVVTPSKVSIPWVVLKLASEFSFVSLSDFRDVAGGMRYYDAQHPDGLEFDGHSDAVPAGVDHNWWVATGTPGTLMQVFVIPEKWREWGVVRGTVYLDEPPGAPERPSTTGTHAAGFTLEHVEDIPEAGDVELTMVTAILPRPYEPGDEKGPLSMIEKPLEISVRSLPQRTGMVQAKRE